MSGWCSGCSAPGMNNIDKDLAFMEITSYGGGRQIINNKLDK